MLRNYQMTAKNNVYSHWNNGDKNVLISMATGTGKTIVFSDIAKDLTAHNNSVLILSHRNVLSEQAKITLENYGLTVSLEYKHNHSHETDHLVLSTMQTICRRLNMFHQNRFDYIIIDEAHHAAANSYLKILDYFKNAKVLGVTATPERADDRSLSNIFDCLAYEYTIKQAIDDKNLVPITAKLLPVNINIDDCRTTKGDIDETDASHAIEPYLENIAKQMIPYCKNKKTVVFLPLVNTAKKFAEILNTYGFRAIELDGNSKNTNDILHDFEHGKYNVICNAMLLTEGWDCPSVDCVVCLRPTQSRNLYCQMVGRGTRLYKNKTELLLLDFLWLSKKHNLCTPAALTKSEDISPNLMNYYLKMANKPSNIFNIHISKDTKLRIFKNILDENANKTPETINPIAPEFAFELLDADYQYQPWSIGKKLPTDKQLKYLQKHHIDTANLTCKDAYHLISIIIAALPNTNYNPHKFNKHNTNSNTTTTLLTKEQKQYLENKDFTNLDNCTFNTAAKLIDKIKKNNGKVPTWMNVHFHWE